MTMTGQVLGRSRKYFFRAVITIKIREEWARKV